MRQSGRLFILAGMLALALSLVWRLPARAQTEVGGLPLLVIEPLTPITVGEQATLVAHLYTPAQTPLTRAPLEVFLDGARVRRVRTDDGGKVEVTLRDLESVGSLEVIVEYAGTDDWQSVRQRASLEVQPAWVEVQTVPPLAGIPFTLDGRTFTSDETGLARIAVEKIGTYHLQLLPMDEARPDLRTHFERWGDEVFEPERVVEVPLKSKLEAGFEVQRYVTLAFKDLQGQPVDPARIQSVTLSSSHGQTHVITDTEPGWLQASRVVRRRFGLEESKILYSVMDVTIAGSNVVNRAQQRFYLEQNTTWTLELLLFSARFDARDALFGFPIGSGVRLEYPDGAIQEWPFESEGGLTLPHLARGLYRVQVVGVRGLAPLTPVALSRDQEVHLKVISYLDMGVVGVAGLVGAFGLLFWGRPQLLRWRPTWRRPPAAPYPGSESG